MARATWINVLSHCVEQENGGRIVGAASWKDAQWLQACGVTLKQVRHAGLLLTRENTDVIVLFYPKEQEEKVQDKREAARVGGSSKTPAKLEAARRNGVKGGRPVVLEPKENKQEITQLKPNENPSTNPTEGKEKESNGKEVKTIAPSANDSDFEIWWEAYPKKKDRPKAQRAYAAAKKKITPEVLLKACQMYAESRVGQDPQYTKFPASWLNAEAWNNAIGDSNGSTTIGTNVRKPGRYTHLSKGNHGVCSPAPNTQGIQVQDPELDQGESRCSENTF